ncbi:two pore domain potassium channel family protein [Candidatus Gracilibacteria bacterium]|nr:two pore domain potassium channel family protein [Candidatus Gracilibacteria bacterium]
MLFLLKPFLRFGYQTLSAIFVVLLGTVTYHILEGWKWLDSLYFSLMTATTVGYGDLHPVTDYGKIFTMFYVIVSIGVISSFISVVAKKNQETTQKISKNLKHNSNDN